MNQRFALMRLVSVTLIMMTLTLGFKTMAADIKGSVTDKDGEPMISATVRLLQAADSAYVAGETADTDGRFTFRNVKPGSYITEVTYVGFAPASIKVKVGEANVNLKPIVLSQSSHMLGEVSVTGVKTPIKVMTDTIEYNADSYLTRPNAVVEDLLKRLPGIEVDSDGKITSNGKEVAKILINGEEFFGDDPTVASKNLPVDIVEKLQVIDRKSELARLTGVDDGEEETVINLTVKPGMQNGWFGNVQGGYGTDDRYMGSFNVSRFQDKNQFTLLGNFNNINEMGFTDSNGQRFQRFGGNNGITTSRSIGANFTLARNEKLKVGGNIFYSNSDKNSLQTSAKQYLFEDSTSYNDSYKRTRDRGNNVRADFRIEWNPDSFNTLMVRPSFSINANRSTSLDSAATYAGDAVRSRVNTTLNDSYSKGNSFEMGLRTIYTHRFKQRRGRSLSIMADYRHSNVTEDSETESFNRFFLLDSLYTYDQYTDNHTWSNSMSSRVSWVEPIGNVKNGNFLTFSYQMSLRWNNTDKLVYDRDYNYDALGNRLNTYNEAYNDSLSNRFRNNTFNQDIRIGYQKVSATVNAEVGMSLVPTRMSSTNLTNSAKTIAPRTTWNYAPFLRFRYKMNKSRSMTANYRGQSSQPSMTQLQPVADMSDPLRIVQGNPNLSPSFNHNLQVRFQDFNMDAQRSIMAMANVSMTQNSIVSKTTYDSETGGQFTTYENVNGVWSGRVMAMVSFPFRRKSWTFSNNLFANFNRSVGFNNGLQNATMNISINEEPGISFRPDYMEFELRPTYQLQTTRSTIQTNVATTVHRYGLRANATGYTAWGLSISSDLNFSATKGYSDGYNTSTWLWNAQIAYQFLSNKSLTATLKVYDLLNQTKNIRRNVTASYIEDTNYNSLTRYFMATLTYTFNTFGKGKRPGMDGDDREGPGGRRRGFGGPPPGGFGGGGRPPM